MGSVSQSHLFQSGHAPFVPFSGGKSPCGVSQRHDHVFDGAGPGQQIEALEHKADLSVPDHGTPVSGSPAQLFTFQQIVTGSRPVKASQNVHQRTFP